MKKQPKLLLIALDAADSGLVRTWASEGHLPTLAYLLENGVVGRIATPPAVLEGAVWPTLITSSSPATHGVFSYLQIKPGTYSLQLGGRADRLRIPPFWVHLSRGRKRVAVIDVPLTRPWRRLNGIQVVNWGAHDGAWSWNRSSWPPRLITDLTARFGTHPVSTCDARDRTLVEYEDLKNRLIGGIRKKAALLSHCLDLENWDFFFGVFSGSHCVGHHFWHFMDPRHPQYDPQAPSTLTTAIRDVYRAIDEGVATLLEKMHPETHVLVVLSHGMGPFFEGSHLIDLVLERLEINPPDNGTSRLATTEADDDDETTKTKIWNMRHLLPASVRQMLKPYLPTHLLTALWSWTHPEPTPWPRMRAFSVPSNDMTGAIRINVRGRDPAGLVEPGREYEVLCRQLSDAFWALENPDTGRRAVQWVARASDLYRGPRLSELPDLFIEWDHSAPIAALRSPQIGTVRAPFTKRRTGSHLPGGLLLGIGPQFRLGQIHEEIQTADIAPTILDFFQVPCPKGYEGRTVLPLLYGGASSQLPLVGTTTEPKTVPS